MKNNSCLVHRLTDSKFGRILREDQIAALAEIATEHNFAAGTRLFEKGCPADAMWVVCSGEVNIQMALPNQGAETILKLGASDLLGWSALVGDGQMSAAAVVGKDACLVKLPADSLKEICLQDHTLGYAIMGTVAFTLATRLKATRQQLIGVAARAEACQPLAIRISDSE